ncbi:hypothetical protein D9M68_820570 [compost metagenome]
MAEPSGWLKMFCFVSASRMLWWMCIALPGSASMGLAMKVAKMPWRSAVSRTVRLNRNTRSARSMASPWVKLISIWPAPASWISVSTPRRCTSQKRESSRKNGSKSFTASIEYDWRPASGLPVRPSGGCSGSCGFWWRATR